MANSKFEIVILVTQELAEQLFNGPIGPLLSATGNTLSALQNQGQINADLGGVPIIAKVNSVSAGLDLSTSAFEKLNQVRPALSH